MSEKHTSPRYLGIVKHADTEAGYAIWVPKGWHRYALPDDHHGVIYSPYPDRFDTSFSAEKFVLESKVTKKDVPILKEGFTRALSNLPEVDVEYLDDIVTPTLITLEARFSFLESDVRRKRWVRSIYWGSTQLVLVAQGATVDEYEYWLPMFYNSMMTLEV